MNQQLQYSIVDQDSIPGEGKITNITLKKMSKTWNLPSSDDFFIFTVKFPAPSVVAFIDIKGSNTYIVDLTFKDYNDRFLTSKSLTFHPHDESKIVEIWERPITTFVDIKLLNNGQDRLKLGLGYLGFLGKCDYIKQNAQPAPTAPKSQKPKQTDIFNERKKRKSINLEQQPANNQQITSQIIQIADQNSPNRNLVDVEAQKVSDIYFEDEAEPHSLHSSLFQKASLKAPEDNIEVEQPKAVSEIEAEDKIVQIDRSAKPYVTYPYNSNEPWWSIMQFVTKQWVEAQRKVETEKDIKEEDRMSAKIIVKHLFTKRILVEGVDPQRRNIIERTAIEMGATIVGQVEDGCILVTTREYGDKIKRMKKFRNCKIVTEEFVYNCRRFNSRLKQDDYLIR